MLAALRGRAKTAENVLENAGHRDPSMDGIEPSEEVSYERSDSDGRASDGEEATDDQTSLGDF